MGHFKSACLLASGMRIIAATACTLFAMLFVALMVELAREFIAEHGFGVWLMHGLIAIVAVVGGLVVMAAIQALYEWAKRNC